MTVSTRSLPGLVASFADALVVETIGVIENTLGHHDVLRVKGNLGSLGWGIWWASVVARWLAAAALHQRARTSPGLSATLPYEGRDQATSAATGAAHAIWLPSLLGEGLGERFAARVSLAHALLTAVARQPRPRRHPCRARGRRAGGAPRGRSGHSGAGAGGRRSRS